MVALILLTLTMVRSRAFEVVTFSVADALPALSYEKLLTLLKQPAICFLIVSAIVVVWVDARVPPPFSPEVGYCLVVL